MPASPYANVRYGGIVAAPDAPQAGVLALAEVPLAAVEAYDATVFPAPRPAFLRAWIGSPGHVGCALVRDGGLVGWGVIRPCRKGCKIGPLVADDRATAEVVPSTLLASVGGGGRSSSTFPASTATRSRWRKTWGSCQCSRLRVCIPARSRRCGWSGYSASPPLSWGSVPRTMVTSHSLYWQRLLQARTFANYRRRLSKDKPSSTRSIANSDGLVRKMPAIRIILTVRKRQSRVRGEKFRGSIG